jgi:hypothetical protein
VGVISLLLPREHSPTSSIPPSAGSLLFHWKRRGYLP